MIIIFPEKCEVSIINHTTRNFSLGSVEDSSMYVKEYIVLVFRILKKCLELGS